MITITKSCNCEKTYFIFREDGTEVKVELIKERTMMQCDGKITPDEANYIRQHLLKK